MTVIPIVIGAPGTISKWMEKGLKDLEIKGQVETIQITALLSEGDTCCNWCTWNNPQRIGKGSWKSEDVPRLSKLQHY